jgi:hypothetical protein
MKRRFRNASEPGSVGLMQSIRADVVRMMAIPRAVQHTATVIVQIAISHKVSQCIFGAELSLVA